MATITKKKTGPKTKKPAKNKKDVSTSYNRYKTFGEQQYTGMKIGGHHKWYYDKGVWKESKLTPDLWRIHYEVIKRRAGKAPTGSGAKVGTGYEWYILAHQRVVKLNADDYTTEMTGLKLKLAHKRADKGKWSASAASQRKSLIQFLKDMIHELEQKVVPLEFEFDGQTWKGEAVPVPGTCHDGVCFALDVTLNDEHLGIIRSLKSGWKLDHDEDRKLAAAIGEEIVLWYE
ncbi:hypothetical protein ACWKWU_00645 [Chitinophaga lutea]